MFLKTRRNVENRGDLKSRAELERAKTLWITQLTSELSNTEITKKFLSF